LLSKNLKKTIFAIISKSSNTESIKLLNQHEKNLLIKIFSYGRSENYLYQYIVANKCQAFFAGNTLAKLKKRCHISNLKKSLILYDCAKVFEILDKNKIKYIPLKGIHINLIFKSLSGFRQIRDIDILIQKDNIQKSINLLQDIGYKSILHKKKDKNNRKTSLITLEKYDIERLYSHNGTCLEIHHTILKNKKNDLLYTCFNQQPSKKNYAIYPDIELLILHLVYHSSSKQGFDVGIQGFIDIYELINNPITDLNKLISLSLEHNLYAELMCFLGIFKNYINNEILEKTHIPNDFDNSFLNSVTDLILYNTASNASIKFFKSSSIKNILILYKREHLLDGIINQNYTLYFLKKLFNHLGLFFLFTFKSIFVKDFLIHNKKSIKILKKLQDKNVSSYNKH